MTSIAYFGDMSATTLLLVLDLVGTSLTHRLVEPERAFIIDMKGWTARSGGTTTTLPPLPLRRSQPLRD